jgi:hypothetical protein
MVGLTDDVWGIFGIQEIYAERRLHKELEERLEKEREEQLKKEYEEYAQVCKHKENGRIIEVVQRVVLEIQRTG